MSTVTLLSRAPLRSDAGPGNMAGLAQVASITSDTPAPGHSDDDDALTYLTANDVRKLVKAYAEMSALGIDPRMVDALAANLGAQRRTQANDPDSNSAAAPRAAPELIAALTHAIHLRAADTSGVPPTTRVVPAPMFGAV